MWKKLGAKRKQFRIRIRIHSGLIPVSQDSEHIWKRRHFLTIKSYIIYITHKLHIVQTMDWLPNIMQAVNGPILASDQASWADVLGWHIANIICILSLVGVGFRVNVFFDCPRFDLLVEIHRRRSEYYCLGRTGLLAMAISALSVNISLDICMYYVSI